MKRLLLLALALSALTACKRPPAEPATGKAREALAPFQGKLKGALMSALSQGLVAAVDACAVQAPKLAAEASVNGIKVGRATAKTRNPQNAADGWKAEALAHFAALPSLENASYSKVLPSGATAYAEPIVTQPTCLVCHGKNVEASTQEAIRKRYPQDQATGYEAGQLRGLFWVEVAPSPGG